MKIQYEVGDKLYERGDYGGERLEVQSVRTNGVTVSNQYGETFFLGKYQVEAAPGTVQDATVIRPDQPIPTDQLNELAANLGAGMTLPEVYDWVKAALAARDQEVEASTS